MPAKKYVVKDVQIFTWSSFHSKSHLSFLLIWFFSWHVANFTENVECSKSPKGLFLVKRRWKGKLYFWTVPITHIFVILKDALVNFFLKQMSFQKPRRNWTTGKRRAEKEGRVAREIGEGEDQETKQKEKNKFVKKILMRTVYSPEVLNGAIQLLYSLFFGNPHKLHLPPEYSSLLRNSLEIISILPKIQIDVWLNYCWSLTAAEF